MKIALITDQHFGARNDSIQFHNYFEKFYNEFFFPYLEEQGIDTIIELGDIFDRRKYINYYSLDRCKSYWFDPIRDKGINLHCIVGNHDIYFKNTNRVNSPNLLLQEYPELKVYDSPEVVNFDGLDILMMPWINNENYEESVKMIEETSATIMMGHLEFKGFEMYRGAVNDHGLDHKMFRKFDMVMSGHFHHKSSKDNIHYLGSPYEMTWSDYDDPRGFHIFDTDKKEFTYVQNPYIIFHKVFYDDVTMSEDDIMNKSYDISNSYVKVVVKNKENPYLFDLFVDRLNSYEPAHIQIVEDNFNLNLEDENDIVDEAEDTITIIKKYIGNLNISDSKPLERLFSDLYQDALSIE